MNKCIECNTAWTSALPICPICDRRVEESPAPGPAAIRPSPDSPESSPRVDGEALLPSGSNPSVSVSVLAPPATEKKPSVPGRPPTALRIRRPESQVLPAARGVDPVKEAAGVTGPVPKPPVSAAPSAPVTATPSGKAPLVLGALAFATDLLLPLTLVLEHHRVFGVLGFCLSAFFAPFAPISWIAGQRAEQRGVESERRKGKTGKLLGQWGTGILVAELTLVLLMIAILRLSGSFPDTFWSAPKAHWRG